MGVGSASGGGGLHPGGSWAPLSDTMGYGQQVGGTHPTRMLIAGSLESAYSLNWCAQEIWGKGGGETLALL